MFAPNSRLRARITPARRGPGGATGSEAGSAEAPSAPASLASSRWARRLKRVFGIDIASCLACGGRLRILACIEDRRTVDAILAHLARKAAPYPERLASPNRTPPLTALTFPSLRHRNAALGSPVHPCTAIEPAVQERSATDG